MISPHRTTTMSVPGNNPTWYPLRPPEAAICYVCSLLPFLLATSIPHSSWAAVQMWTPCHSLCSHSLTFVFLLSVSSVQVPSPYVLLGIFCDRASKEKCVKQMIGSGKKKKTSHFPSFGSYLPWPLLLTSKEFNCKILNLLISLSLPNLPLSVSLYQPLSPFCNYRTYLYRLCLCHLQISSQLLLSVSWWTDVTLGHTDKQREQWFLFFQESFILLQLALLGITL